MKRSRQPNAEAKKYKEQLNLVVSMFWTILLVFPVAWFCIKFVPVHYIIAFVCISLIAYFIPSKKYRVFKNQFKKKWIGILGRLTQDSGSISKLVRSKYPGFTILKGKKEARSLLHTAKIREAFHFQMFLLYLMVMVYALLILQWSWAVIIIICNFLYNVWPIIYLQTQISRLEKIKSGN